MKKKVLIVTASYYLDITSSLKAEAELLLKGAKIKFNIIDVPGVFEIPVTIAKNIRQSVDLAVNRRKQRHNSVQATSKKRMDTAGLILEVAGDKKLQNDTEYQKM